MANTYQGYNETSWERMATTTLAEHISENELVWMRNFQMLALLEANGRISYSHGGNGFDWRMRYKQHQVEGNTGETARNFVRMSPFKVANLPWRGYQATDAISVLEKEAAKGTAGQVKIIDNLVGSIEDSIKQALAAEVWTDGTLAANAQMWHGIESIFGTPTQSFTIDTNAARSANAADKALINNQTYASINTAQGTYGGSEEASTSWPDGLADPEYDFASPLMVNAKSTAFAPSTHTFAGQGDDVLRYCIIASQRNTLVNTQITNVIMARNFYNDFLNLIDSKEQMNITGVPDGLRGLGFKNVVMFDGVELSWEASVPTACAYGFNYNNIELLSMFETLFRPEGPTYDMDNQFYKAVVSTLSNIKFNQIRSMFKVYNAT
jgi:hypothetical protein